MAVTHTHTPAHTDTHTPVSGNTRSKMRSLDQKVQIDNVNYMNETSLVCFLGKLFQYGNISVRTSVSLSLVSHEE